MRICLARMVIVPSCYLLGCGLGIAFVLLDEAFGRLSGVHCRRG